MAELIVLALTGSLRKLSYNRALVNAAIEWRAGAFPAGCRKPVGSGLRTVRPAVRGFLTQTYPLSGPEFALRCADKFDAEPPAHR